MRFFKVCLKYIDMSDYLLLYTGTTMLIFLNSTIFRTAQRLLFNNIPFSAKIQMSDGSFGYI